MWLTYAIAIVVVLALCALGLSVGLLLRGRPLQTCGRAAATAQDHGHEISCPTCGNPGTCKRKKGGASS